MSRPYNRATISAMEVRRRSSLRSPAKGYREHGAYFITICTHERALLFDDPRFRAIATRDWEAIPTHFPFVELDEFVIMPNHVHGVLWLLRDEIEDPGSSEADARRPTKGSVSSIVGSYKAAVSLEINAVRGIGGPAVWQRNFYDHMMRNERDLLRIQQYIIDNPARWAFDRDNPRGSPDEREHSFWETVS